MVGSACVLAPGLPLAGPGVAAASAVTPAVRPLARAAQAPARTAAARLATIASQNRFVDTVDQGTRPAVPTVPRTAGAASYFGVVVRRTATVLVIRTTALPIHLQGGRLVFDRQSLAGGGPGRELTFALTAASRLSGSVAPGASVFVGALRAAGGLRAQIVANIADGRVVTPSGGLKPVHVTVTRNAVTPRALSAADCSVQNNEGFSMADAQVLVFEGCIGGPSYTATIDFGNVEIFNFGAGTISINSVSATYALGGFNFLMPVGFGLKAVHPLDIGNPDNNDELAVSVTPISPSPAYLMSGGVGFNMAMDFTVNTAVATYTPTVNLGIFSGITQGGGAAPLSGASASIPAAVCPSVGAQIPDTPINAVDVQACFPFTLEGGPFGLTMSASGAALTQGSATQTPVSNLSFGGSATTQVVNVDPSATVFTVTLNNFSYTPTLVDQVYFNIQILDATVYSNAGSPFVYDTGPQPLVCAAFPSCPPYNGGLSGSEPTATTFTVNAAASATGAYPNAAADAGGARVLINGDGFVSASGSPTIAQVYFNAFDPTTDAYDPVPATSFQVLNNTEILAVVPASPYAGTVGGYVSVETTGGLVSSVTRDDGWHWLPPPTVSGIQGNWSPTSGGAPVVIGGSDFMGASQVLFGGVPAQSFTVEGENTIDAVAPPHVGGTVDIQVVSKCGYQIQAEACGTSAPSTADRLRYLPPPTVTGLTPGNGPIAGGSAVTITGTGFTSVHEVEFIAGASAFDATDVHVVNDGEITAVTPASSPEIRQVIVVAGCSKPGDVLYPSDATACGASQATGLAEFSFLPPPWITTLSPNRGGQGGGATVTATGSGFSTATAVDVGGVSVPFQVVSDESLTFTTPATSTTGGVDVQVTTACGSAATSTASSCGQSPVIGTQDTFTYLPAPTVTSISPAWGPAGQDTVIYVHGSGFNTTSKVMVGQVTLPSANYAVVDDGEIALNVPGGQSAGEAPIVVTTSCTGPDAQQATSCGSSATTTASTFDFLPLPTVTAVTPVNGPENQGASVVVHGTGFTNVAWVRLDQSPVPFTVVNQTTIDATLPAEGASIRDLQVTTDCTGTTVPTSCGQSLEVAVDRYTYLPPPTLTAISPANGPALQTAQVTVFGTGFATATALSVGSVTVPVTVQSNTELTATLPADAVGSQALTVTTACGTAGTTTATSCGQSAPSAADVFRYLPLPTVTAVSPDIGSPGGGTEVTIDGAGFTTAVAVDFGNRPATQVHIDSDGRITATAPAGSGTVNVTVTTACATATTRDATSCLTSKVNGADRFTYAALLVTSSLARGALDLSGAGILTSTIPLYVDSSAADAIRLEGEARLSAPAIQVVGAVASSGTASMSTTPQTGGASMPDFLAGLSLPAPGADLGSVDVRAGRKILQPGTYDNIAIDAGARVTLEPGTYVVLGSVSLSGTATMTGQGAVLVIESASNSGGLTVTGNASVAIEAPTAGPLAGLCVVAAPAGAVTVLGGGSLTLGGGLYVRSGAVDVDGTATLSATLLVAGTVAVGGKARVRIS